MKNFITNEIFHSNSNMTSEDILSVANAAKVANYFDGYVNWCKAALETAKVERSFDQIILYHFVNSCNQ